MILVLAVLVEDSVTITRAIPGPLATPKDRILEVAYPKNLANLFSFLYNLVRDPASFAPYMAVFKEDKDSLFLSL